MSNSKSEPKFPMPIGRWCCIRKREIEGVYELYHVLPNKMLASSKELAALIEWFSIDGSKHDREDFA